MAELLLDFGQRVEVLEDGRGDCAGAFMGDCVEGEDQGGAVCGCWEDDRGRVFGGVACFGVVWLPGCGCFAGEVRHAEVGGWVRPGQSALGS